MKTIFAKIYSTKVGGSFYLI